MDELTKKRSEVAEKMQAMIDLCNKESRDFNENEEKEFTALNSQLDSVKKMIERQQKLDEEIALQKQPVKTVYIAGRKAKDNDDEREFKNLADFVGAIYVHKVEGRYDKRLDKVEYREGKEFRVQEMQVGSAGGFAVPDKFRPGLLQVTPQEAAIRPRAQVWPATDPPDAKVTMPALDQTGSSNMYGGVVMYKVGEGATLTETSAKLKEVSWEPHGIGAFMQITNKLVRNWQDAPATFEGLFRKAMIGYEETQFYNGNGVAGPQGVLSAPCRIEYTRATTSQIAFADVSGMLARYKFGGSPVWIASQTTLPQLVTIRDSGNNQLFVMDVTEAIPGTLYGIPLFLHDRSVALGTTGDLVLGDFQYYVIQDGSGPYVSVSEHVYFTSEKLAMKIVWYVDGKSWLSAAIPLEGSTSNTVSPFVILK